MKRLITAKDVEAHLASGGSPDGLPADALYTPSAQDALREARKTAPRASKPSAASEPSVPDHEYHWKPGWHPANHEELQAFFHSPEIARIKKHIVAIGQRIWSKDYVDGNGGNITVRVGDNLVLCTPTLISKGFMGEEDICLVDMNGTQLAGNLKRTSEVNTHLGIMKRQPKAKSCVHAHPPHATAFAVASVCPPTCMIPEAEVFLGKIGFAEYRTPGSQENADIVGEVGIKHQSVIMQNHGVITWGKDVEDAYWKMENTDAYCKTVWIASQLGNGLTTIKPKQLKELLAIRQKLGMEDARLEMEECKLCDNSDFRPGVTCAIPDTPDTGKTGSVDPEAEALIKEITAQILQQLKK